MKIEKNTKISLIYIVLLYLLYNFLFQKFDYTIRYLINFVFLVLIFVKFVFGQLDFYAERFRYKDVFINLGINAIFSVIIFVFLPVR